MLVFGLTSTVFDLLTFGLLLKVFDAGEALFQTAWFVVSLLTELAVLLVLRTHRPAWRSRPSTLLWASAAAVAVLALLLPYVGPTARLFGLVPLPAALLGSLLGVVLAYGGHRMGQTALLCAHECPCGGGPRGAVTAPEGAGRLWPNRAFASRIRSQTWATRSSPKPTARPRPRPTAPTGVTVTTKRGQKVSLERGSHTRSKKNPGKRAKKGG